MVKTKTAKKFFWCCILTIFFILFICATAVVVIDPYFHYHKPLPGISYRMREERYTNPGIAKNFDYQTIITGTSMTRNFMPSQIDDLYDTTSVKLPVPGGKYGDIHVLLKTAFDANQNLERVIVTLDLDRIVDSYDDLNDDTVPYYLYDHNPFNDVNYVLNKTVLIHDCLGNLLNTLQGGSASTLDSYGAYENDTGKKQVLNQYQRSPAIDTMKAYTDEIKHMVIRNVEENYISLIAEHPDTEFLFVIPPYSIVYWDQAYRNGELSNQLQAEQDAVRLLLTYSNVSVYCFYEDTELICDLDNYYDMIHYDADTSKWMMEQIKEHKYLLTEQNLEEHCNHETEFFTHFAYETLFQ